MMDSMNCISLFLSLLSFFLSLSQSCFEFEMLCTDHYTNLATFFRDIISLSIGLVFVWIGKEIENCAKIFVKIYSNKKNNKQK